MTTNATAKSELNNEQRQAAELLWQSKNSALQLIAGAGSGKTTTLIAAIESATIYGYAPERIAVITFTRKAARELTERIARQGIVVGYCGTIHALAWRLLRQAGLKRRLLVHTASTKAKLIRSKIEGVAHVPDHLLNRRDFISEHDAKKIARLWQAYLQEHKQIDFDSLVPMACELEQIGGTFDVLFIDEFQDTSPEQVKFALKLSPKKIFVVGDDWQSIYRFRGADVSLSYDFRHYIPDALRLFLVKNYRSRRPIVTLGNRVIRMSSLFVRKKLKATKNIGRKPIVYLTQAAEAELVWQKFLLHTKRSASLPNPVTILVRTNAQRRLLECQLPQGFSVMTIHKSKGLEFDNVLVFGIAEHIMPHRENDYDEEVRILYVALSRAKNFLGFVAWEDHDRRSVFLPFLLRHCRLQYF